MDIYRRRRLVAVGLLLAIAGGVAAGILATRGPSLTPAQIAQRARAERIAKLRAAEAAAVAKAKAAVNVRLPTREGALAPATPNRLFVRPLPRREVVSFAPYWTISSLVPGGAYAADVRSSSVLVYSAVCAGGDSSILATAGDCANGLAGLGAADFSSFVGYAHAEGARVLLSVQTIDPAVIHAFAVHPSARAATLANNVYGLVRSGGLDGVNLDIEGRGPRDRAGYARFVADFVGALRAHDRALEVVADTYPQSAASTSDFFDVKRIARSVDALFVMAYQMEKGKRSSANSPLASKTLGWSVAQTLVQYRALVPANKIVLGLPFYGLNFATKTKKPGSRLVSDTPGSRLYSAISAVGRPAYWDVWSASPYTVFRQDGGWHQDWYDDPVSLALKSALAADFKTAGVGVWALTMEGSDPMMMQALTGGRTPRKPGAVHH